MLRKGKTVRKTGWEEPTTGPDWIDVESLMRALQALHSAHVAVIVSPFGTGATGGVDVAVSALFERLSGSQLPANVAVSKAWPCSTHKTFASHAFSLLHELDYEISKVYEQSSLWK
jgi:argininosuccinate lyase